MNEATKYLKIKDFNFGSGGFSAKHREASLSGVLSASRRASRQGRAVNKKKQKPGPKEERLIIPGNWREAVKKSFEKEKPPEGWPQPEPKKKLPTAQPTATNKGNHAQT